MVDVYQPLGTLRSQQEPIDGKGFAPILNEPADGVLLDPWLLTENDLQWLISLGKKRYGVEYDYLTVEGWFRNIVLKNPTMFLAIRTASAYQIGLVSLLPWLPSMLEYHVVFICADDGAMWEAAKLLRSSVEWATKRGCKRWHLTSDTKFDLAPIARRLGADEISPRFTINL